MIEVGVTRFPYCKRCNARLDVPLDNRQAAGAPDQTGSGGPPRQSRIATAILALMIVVPVGLGVLGLRFVMHRSNMIE
jgi:hypothetical protein